MRFNLKRIVSFIMQIVVILGASCVSMCNFLDQNSGNNIVIV